MRFFAGMRSGEKKKSEAAKAFERKSKGMPDEKKTPAEEFQEMLDNRTMKMMKDYVEGKKKNNFNLPGAKQETDEEAIKKVSVNAKKMFELLAKKKLEKDMKKQRKREYEWEKEKKKQAQEAEALKAKKAFEYEQQQKAYQAQQESAASSSASYFWGTQE